jgi:hypothetical protein
MYDNDSDGKTKHDHIQEMLIAAVADKRTKARIVLVDSWYASVENLNVN